MKPIEEMIWGDLLAGGGGTTTGALAVKNVSVAWALNHSKEAIYTHQVNHPNTEHFHADLKEMDISKLCKVNGLWVSLECTNFSNAKGGLPRDPDSRTLAYELTPYIIYCEPSYIIVENVKEFMSWGPLDEKGKPVSRDKGKDFLKWIDHVKSLGYVNYDHRLLNSANYGAYTSRKRYFGIFSLPGYEIAFPEQTHHKSDINGFKKWLPCKDKIDLESTGQSIFGRKYNPNLAKHVRRPLVERSISRIINGMKKHCPEMLQYIVKYYGAGGGQHSSINKPLDTITTKDRHVLVTLEKEQFINQCWGNDYNHTGLKEPLKTITTTNKHQLVTVEKKNFIIDQTYSNDKSKLKSIDEPLNTITAQQRHQLVTIEKQQFLTQYYGRDNANQKIDEPIKTITTWNSQQLITIEKKQFISTYFGNSGGHSLEKPLGTLTTKPKHALTTILANGDFDIKIRFLTPKELAGITGFPENYQWYGSKAYQIWMIGNAVPVLMAKAIIEQIKIQFETN